MEQKELKTALTHWLICKKNKALKDLSFLGMKMKRFGKPRFMTVIGNNKSISFFDLSDFYSWCGNLYHLSHKIAIQSKFGGKIKV